MTRTMKILFTVSVVLNVLLVGTVGGMVYKHWKSHSWHEVRKTLEPETRHLMARTFQEKRREIAPKFEKARGARHELIDVMGAEEFDEAAFERLMADLIQVQGEIFEMRKQSMKTMALQLPASERKKVAVKFVETLSGRPHHKKPRRKPEWKKQKSTE